MTIPDKNYKSVTTSLHIMYCYDRTYTTYSVSKPSGVSVNVDAYTVSTTMKRETSKFVSPTIKTSKSSTVKMSSAGMTQTKKTNGLGVKFGIVASGKVSIKVSSCR